LQKWTIRFSVAGDARFLSHHDSLRVVERLCARGKIRLKHSQGFNPHPVFSIALPRPVGVASQCEVVTISLDEPMTSQALLESMNASAPAGMRFVSAAEIDHKPSRPLKASYEIEVDAAAVEPMLSKLRSQNQWIVQRQRSSGKNGQFTPRPIDLLPLVDHIELTGKVLKFTLVRQGDAWARPGEVLELLGLDGRVDLARLARTNIEFESCSDIPAPAPCGTNDAPGLSP